MPPTDNHSISPEGLTSVINLNATSKTDPHPYQQAIIQQIKSLCAQRGLSMQDNQSSGGLSLQRRAAEHENAKDYSYTIAPAPAPQPQPELTSQPIPTPNPDLTEALDSFLDSLLEVLSPTLSEPAPQAKRTQGLKQEIAERREYTLSIRFTMAPAPAPTMSLTATPKLTPPGTPA